MEPLVVTASELDDHEWCPQYHEWRWRTKRRLSGPEPEWAVLGKWLHLQMESMIQGHPPSAQLTPPIPIAKGRALLAAVHAWWAKYGREHPWESVLVAEKSLSVDIGKLKSGRRVVFRGIPDAVVVWDGALWHCSHKSLSGYSPVDVFCAGLARELHECLYPLLVRASWPGLPYGGTLANIVRKLAERRTNEDAAQALHIEFIPVDEADIERARRDAIELCEVLDSKRRARKSCTGKFGNSLCAYYGPCWRGIPIESALFEDANPLERYEGSTS